jgi:N utilization substance protein A
VGQRLKVNIVEVAKTSKGPRVVVSRSHPDLVRRLFEVEVPEIHAGVVEVKSIAREAGSRSKVAVAAKQEGVDPVGCCVGLRGIRIQNIVSELNGEKIDVVAWSQDPATFIASALNPAQIVGVELNRNDGVATVVVPDRQLSLAIGKEGQNVRLAAKLTGWRIDIKSASAAEASKPAVEIVKATEAVVPSVKEEVVVSSQAGVSPTVVPVVKTPEPVLEKGPASKSPGSPASTDHVRLRFAEDILTPAKPEVDSRKKKKKKTATGKESEEDIASRRSRRGGADYTLDEDEEF